MAGGPILPVGIYPSNFNGRIYPQFYLGGGGNAAPYEEDIHVVASLDADADMEMRFPMPPTIPSGTLKLRLLALANATSGAAKLTVSDGTCPAGSSPSGVTLTSEPHATVTWGPGDADTYKELKVTLSATPAGSDMLVIDCKLQTSGWTLAAVSCWIPMVVWE